MSKQPNEGRLFFKAYLAINNRIESPLSCPQVHGVDSYVSSVLIFTNHKLILFQQNMKVELAFKIH